MIKQKVINPRMTDTIPRWAWSVLSHPGGRGSVRSLKDLIDGSGRSIARIDKGVLRFAVADDDASIAYYRSIGGAHFHERSANPYAMSSLDTSVYHSYLRQVAPRRRDAVVVDIGGGDGRNAIPWLEWGYKRVVVIDPVAEALWRFRERISARNPEWLDCLLLIEGDARALPLIAGAADRVLAVEVLCYLNAEYEKGLQEIRRIMRPDATLLLSDRDYEGGLLTRLLYDGGIEPFIDMGRGREMWDGVEGKRVRTRCFTREELLATVKGEGFRILEDQGISVFALILSFLSKLDRLGPSSDTRYVEVGALLASLARNGTARRCHVLIAIRGRRPPSTKRRTKTRGQWL